MTASQPDLHLVYTSDANYLFLTAVSACSAFAQASDPTRLAIHVLDCGISDDAWEAWRADMVRRTGLRPALPPRASPRPGLVRLR